MRNEVNGPNNQNDIPTFFHMFVLSLLAGIGVGFWVYMVVSWVLR